MLSCLCRELQDCAEDGGRGLRIYNEPAKKPSMNLPVQVIEGVVNKAVAAPKTKTKELATQVLTRDRRSLRSRYTLFSAVDPDVL